MKLLRNTSITIKLLTLVLPSIICLVAVIVLFVDLFHSTIDDAETSLYDELYVSTSTIINADRDFYQAAIAEQELVLLWDLIEHEKRESLIGDFNENAKQVSDRIRTAMDHLKDNAQLYNEYIFQSNGKTLQELEESFFANFASWEAAFDVNTNTGDKQSRNTYFEQARDDINSMTELLDEYAGSTINRIENQVNDVIHFSIMAVGAMILLLLIISAATILYLRNNVRYITGICNKIADGQFDLEVNPKKFGKGEIGQLCRATSNILSRLNNYVNYIKEITTVLDLMANGDMRIKLQQEYAGEFKSVKEALLGISGTLGHTLSVISVSSAQVNTGASQVSVAAQSLADRSTKQANDVESLLASIKDVAQQVSDNTADASSAKSLAVEAGQEVVIGNQHMQDMLRAMSAINTSSSEVSKIMKVIDDIAFQTNILALNAAIEAARAGSAGQGFAIVADEVRNLAGKAGEAATQTTMLIHESVKAAEDGQKTANRTADSLKLIEEKTLASKTLIENIASASTAQSQTLGNIKDVVMQIADVVQTNASAAEESAAASEELDAQAVLLNSTISRFKLP